MIPQPVRQLFPVLLAALGRLSARILASERFRHVGLVALGCAVVLIQGQAGVQAAELPQVLTGVNARFDGANLPVVTGNNMVINQFADKATLHWQSFNVSADAKVEFKQPSTTSVALNRIFDAAPSQVNGQLTANGQVYLINSNGIVFGHDAQVNTQSLVASTLDIDDRVYEEVGFVNAINDPSGALPAFESFGRPMGEIHVEEGAEITTAKTGRVLVFAPTIVNEGTIRTPEGQQVLAAVQDKVLIAASDDPNLRGLLVEVSTGGSVTNLGNLVAERGNVSLIGLAVNQEGVARATTSVALNGSVRLLARDMNGTLALGNDLVPRTPKPVRGGDVTLAAGSVTEVVPDTTPDAKGAEIRALDAQSQAQSRVEIAGTRVRLESGARVTSTGGVIDVTAARNPGQADLGVPGDPANFTAELVVEDGALVDASGDDTTVVSVARNIVDVEARGNELADSPLQRDGPIRNETLQVDIRKGTDFLNIDGAAASIQRSAAERQSAGGSVRFRSEGDFVLADGATVDVSGGRVTYTDGLVTTSKLRQANGKVVDISAADPNQAYLGLAPSAPAREAGYVEGKDAGAITIQARGIDLAGTIRAGTTAGANQRQRPGELGSSIPAYARPWDEAPRNGGLALTFLGGGLPELVVGTAPAVGTGGLVLSADQLRATGAGRIGLVNAGAITVNGDLDLAPWSELTLTGTQVSVLADVRIAGGTLRLNSTNALVGAAAAPDETLVTRIDGTIDLAGTWVNDGVLVNAGRATAPVVLDGGQLVVDSGASIEVSEDSLLDVSAGAWRRADGGTAGGSGGSMSFSTGTVALNPAAGARLDLRGELRAFGFEGGGSLDIETERIRIVADAAPVGDADVRLEGDRQFALAPVSNEQGDTQYTLEIGAGTFQQGGFSAYSLTSTRSDLAVAGGADVVLRAASLQLAGSAPSLAPTGTAVAGVAAPVFAPAFARGPVSLELASTEGLANAIGPVADLHVAAGARIRADAGSRISLRSETSLYVDGTIEAPAGTISLAIAGGPPIFQPAQMIRLGAGAVLNASGTALIDTLSPLGLRPGEVLAGGTVRIRADQGSVFGAAGARIAVDGAVASVDTGFGGLPVRREVASGAGAIELTAAESLVYQGSLSGRAPAGFAVPAGRLTVSIDPSRRGVPSLAGPDGIPRGPHTLVVGDYDGTIPDAGQAADPQIYSTGFVPLAALSAGGFSSLELVARSSAAGTSDTGAPVPDTPDSLPIIEFRDDLDLALARSIRLDAAVLRTDGAQVALAAPYVSIGYGDSRVALDGAVPDKTSASNPQETTTPLRLTPTAGTGRLAVSGELIELVGESVTQGFGDAAAGSDGVVLQASGDIRLRGVRKTLQSDYGGLFRTAGNLAMTAQRIYPTTLTDFEVAVEGAGGRIAIGGGGGAPAPLSVGGTLTLRADEIVQGGALFAPLGELTLDAGSSLRFTTGSLTSTSAAGVRAPFFRTEPGGALIIPAPGAGEDQVVFVEDVANPEFERALPEKRIRLSAPDIELQDGSQFDLRGGSDVFATEFVPGPGGTVDILRADLDSGAGIDPNGSFAILPAAGAYAPYDPLETPDAAAVQGLRVGDTLVLAEGLPGLPAGEYAILPARYALFGGYLVTPEQGFQDIGAGAGLQRLDGAPIVAGRLGVAGSDAAAGRSQGFAIEDGETVRQRAEYLLTALDKLYDGDVLRAPGDAGSLGIEAGDRLDLRGELIRGTGTGLGSTVDIATNAALSVVTDLTGANGIELRAVDLGNLGADSLLLGGTRTAIEGGVLVTATSSQVTIESGVQLDLPELILAGDRIVVAADGNAPTRLASSATATAAGDTRLRVEDDAAVVAVSGRRLAFERASPAGDSGISIAGGARLDAAGGIVVDATGDVTADGAITVTDGGVLNLGAAAVSIGATDGETIDAGLVLSNADLAAIAGSDLRLRSRGLVDVYGEVADPAGSGPLAFGNLTIDAQGIRGRSNAGATAVLAAESVTLRNGSGADAAGGAPAGAGSALRIEAADAITLGDGAVALAGFGSARLAAGSAVLLAGEGRLDVTGDLLLDAPVITAASAADTTISASGLLTVTAGVAGTTPAAGRGLGAALALEGADIDFAGRILLPSGSVRLTQRGDTGAPVAGAGIDVATGATIDVAGETLQFATKKVGTPGGSIALVAQTGSIAIAGGATLDASGAEAGGEAGALRLQAAQGGVALAAGASLLARDAAQDGGSLVLDAARLEGAGNGLTALNALLDAGGFRAARSIRLREQDLVVESGVTLAAREIRLVSDTGRVEVAGTLDASGPRAGGIWLAAGDALVVSGTLAARGTVAGAGGGRVDLLALDADGDDVDGAALDTVTLASGSLIDVSAGEGGAGGTVLAHVRRLDSDGDGQTDQVVAGGLDGQVLGAARAQLVATRVLRDPDAEQFVDGVTGETVTRVTIGAVQVEAWRSETEAFLNATGGGQAGPLELTAGLQVESTGDIVVQDRWNFMEGWYFGQDLFTDPTAPRLGLTGTVTLRAARNLDVQADLTDGFAEQFLFGFLPFDGAVGAVPVLDGNGAVAGQAVRQSWGYRLAAGADLASADVMAVGTGAASLRLGEGVRVRTGTGDIDIAASGDVRLESGAAVYTAGWDRGLSRELLDVLEPILSAQGLTAYDFFGTFLNGGQFADGGGTVRITAGGDLVAATAPGDVTAWLTRVGSGQVTSTTLYSAIEGFGAMPTHWGVVYGEFRNGIAAFGGGDLRVDVGGDVRNAVLAAPTTGRVLDGVEVDTSTSALQFLPSARRTEILGGGNVELRAGGRLEGGQVLLGRGSATLRTAGGASEGAAPQLFIGSDASLDWLGGGSVRVGGLLDPTVAALSDTQLNLMTQLFSNIRTTADIDNRFFTYTDGSRVSVASLGGDVSLDGPGFGGFLPPSLTAVAFSGDVNVVANPLDFFPAATGTLQLLARGNVTGNFVGSAETRLRQSDQDRSLLPSVDRPDIRAGANTPARVPVHTGDTVPNLIVAVDGSIRSQPGRAGFWTLEFAKPTVMKAGTDISNVSVRVQHIDPRSTSSFQAGRDIVQSELRDNTGRFAANDRRIFEVWGPGSAEFVAFRNISLGTSAGIETIGNSRNPALAAEGASLRLLAGTGGDPAYDRFVEVYLSSAPSAYRDELNAFLAEVDAARAGYPASSEKTDLTIGAGEYATELAKFLADNGIEVVGDDPVATFLAQDRIVQRDFITGVLFAELETWGTESETPDRADRLNYLRGYTALDTLFALADPLGERAAGFADGEIAAAVGNYLTIADPAAANAAQVALFGAVFPQEERKGDISLLLSQVQTLAGGSLSMLAPGGDINAGAADADIIAKEPADLGIVTARGGDIDIAVDRDLLVNSTRVFALQGDLLIWSSNGNIDAGKGAKTVTSVPDPITSIDPNTGNTIIEFPPAVAGSGLQGENAALFAPRGAVNAGDAGIRTSGDLTIGAVEIVGADNIDVGGVEIGFSTTDVVAVAPPGAASASSAATKGMESEAGMLGDEDELGERKILGTEVSFISVEVLSFGDGENCAPGDEDCD